MTTSVHTGDADPGEEAQAGEAAGWFSTGIGELGTCFGCGPANPDGLRLRFRKLDDGVTVETHLHPPPFMAGVAGVLHGGIQATVLDEVMGVAAAESLPPGPDRPPCVTAEIALRYLRPVPMEGHVVARARLERVDGRDLYVRGEIVAADGTALTTADSRWRQLRPR